MDVRPNTPSNPFHFKYPSHIIMDEDLIIVEEIEIEKVIFRDLTTIVVWTDGTRTVVNCENEEYDKEKGLAMCVVKKFLGNYTKFDKALEDAVYDYTLSRKERKSIELYSKKETDVLPPSSEVDVSY